MSFRHRPLTLLAVAALLTSFAAQAQRLNDTGQTTCYNASASTGAVSGSTPDPETAGFGEQDCTRGAAAADALGRMVKVGGSSVPGRDYSKVCMSGEVAGKGSCPADPALGSGANDWACTRDNVTGLIWEIKTDDAGLRDKDWTYTWYDTESSVNGGNAGSEAGAGCNSTLANCNTTAFRDAVNAAGLCGATDWRLPTANELSGLVNAGAATGPTIDGDGLPNTVNGIYWSGESFAPNASGAWSVIFVVGILDGSSKNGNHQVRLVRGGQ